MDGPAKIPEIKPRDQPRILTGLNYTGAKWG